MTRGFDKREAATELRGIFPDFTQSDFFEIRGNPMARVYYTTERFGPDYKVVIEFPPGYPDSPPKAFVLEPAIDTDCPHAWAVDEETGGAKICFIKPSEWRSWYSAYDAAAMIKSWVFAYENWKRTGDWAWEEEEHLL